MSSYPAKADEMNLRTIPHMKKVFGCSVGLSDHSLEIGLPVAAVSLGATMIEKHFTLSRKIKTVDSFFSIEPQELKEIVKNIRGAERALGKIHYGLTNEERKNRVFRRSLFAVKDVKKGEVLTENNVRSIRPGNGLKPKYLNNILGKKAKKSIARGTPLNRKMF